MEQISVVLSQLASQLGVAVEYLWPTLVHYTWAQAMAGLIIRAVVVVLVWVGGAVALVEAAHAYKVDWKDYNSSRTDSSRSSRYKEPNSESGYTIFTCLVLAVMIMTPFFTLIYLDQAIATVLAPEGATLQNILTNLR